MLLMNKLCVVVTLLMMVTTETMAKGSSKSSKKSTTAPLRAIGQPCSSFSDCASSNCIGGYCRCNTVSNAGCILPKVCQGSPPTCQDQDRVDDCKTTGDCDVGEACNNNSNCLSTNCEQGLCKCKVGSANLGCSAGKVCVLQNGISTCENPLSINAACQNNAQCQHGNCYNGFCRCNVGTNVGCQVGRCGFAPGFANDPPECLLAKGVYGCSSDRHCDTGYCFDDPDTSSGVGTCTCDPGNNNGCPNDWTCVSDPLDDEPKCVQVRVDDCKTTNDCVLGETCDVNSDCLSTNCVQDVCRCKVDVSHLGCDASKVCVLQGGSPTCTEPLGINAACQNSAQCLSTVCVQDVCRCKVDASHLGCDAGKVCALQGGIATCVNPLPINAACRNNAQCQHGNCFKYTPSDATGVCTCDPINDNGCLNGNTCDIDPNDVPKCVPKAGDRVGCDEDNDCISGFCYQPPSGECRCIVNTNVGCESWKQCNQWGSTPPVCVLGGWNAECYHNSQCEYDHCYENECKCNLNTNAGCQDGTFCGPVNGLGTASPPICHLTLSRNDDCDHDFQCSGGDKCVNGECKCVPGNNNRGLTECNRRDLLMLAHHHGLLRGA